MFLNLSSQELLGNCQFCQLNTKFTIVCSVLSKITMLSTVFENFTSDIHTCNTVFSLEAGRREDSPAGEIIFPAVKSQKLQKNS